MGFFDALRRVLPHRDTANEHAEGGDALARAWGLDEAGAEGEEAPHASEYDKAQWIRKLKRILEGLPETRAQWSDLASDAKALGLEDRWIRDHEREEFRLLVRRAVADRHFSEAEHKRLDLARELIGMPEAEAEKILHDIVAEAEKFFGRAIEGA